MISRGRPVQGSRLVGSRGVGRGSRDVGSRGVGRLAVGGIGRLTGVHNIRNIAAVGVRHLVIDRLQTTVRQNDGIRAGGGVAVPLFAGVDLHSVVVVHAVVVGVDGGLVVGRGVGRGGGGVGRGVAVAGCVISDGQSGDGGKNNEDLKSNSDKVVALLLTGLEQEQAHSRLL
jgi:hypothetical protein